MTSVPLPYHENEDRHRKLYQTFALIINIDKWRQIIDFRNPKPHICVCYHV